MTDNNTQFGFKFAIGADVFFAVAVRECAAMNTREEKLWRAARPQRFTVQERIVNECYGGVQRAYYLRASGLVGSMEVIVGIVGHLAPTGLYQATENELVLAVEEPESADAVDPQDGSTPAGPRA
jgi:hypothetical protein